MCHSTIGSNVVDIQSQPDWNTNNLKIADGVLIKNSYL